MDYRLILAHEQEESEAKKEARIPTEMTPVEEGSIDRTKNVPEGPEGASRSFETASWNTDDSQPVLREQSYNISRLQGMLK